MIECQINNRLFAGSLDAELVAGMRQRDEAALVEVIERYGSQVKAICMRICTDELEADEVVSVVFWELWNGTDKVNLRRGTLRAYLLTLARSRSIDRQRAAAARKRNYEKYFESNQAGWNELQSSETGMQAQLNTERGEQLRDAIAKLPASQRSALEMAFFDGLTHREVADRQCLPLGTIKTNIRRGLLQLRNMMLDAAGRERGLV